jgi:hypothetical protein
MVSHTVNTVNQFIDIDDILTYDGESPSVSPHSVVAISPSLAYPNVSTILDFVEVGKISKYGLVIGRFSPNHNRIMISDRGGGK